MWIISQFICGICKLYRIKLLWKLEFWHNFFNFLAKSLANIAFPEFVRWMPSTQRSSLVILRWSIKKVLFLWYNSFKTSLIWPLSMEVLVDVKIELIPYQCYNFDKLFLCALFFFSFSSDISFLRRLSLIPT